MLILKFPGVIDFEVRGERIQEMLTQELVDLAQTLARNPELVDRLDTESMRLREEVLGHGASR